jgi:2-dehydro-3-deoxyphosphogluconate aldolase / (4S)-4-hydroxy-2-oxoglutarate aldolase
MQKTEVLSRIRDIGIIPIVRVSSAHHALSMAEALHAAQLDTIEIPMGVPDAVGIISTLVERYRDKLLVGAGTVMDVDSAATVIEAGACYVISPSLDPEVVQYCNASGVAVIPGALPPTEIVNAAKVGADMVKVFPCSALGGASYIKALKALKVPLTQIDLFPTGGVTLQNAAAFIHAGACVLGIGSDLIDLSALREGKLDRIADRARLYMDLVREARASQDTATPQPFSHSSSPGLPASKRG